MWEQIVLNLLSNALKFTFEGEIQVSLRQREDHAELTIRDTGTGIPESEMPRLFERFHRVEGARGRTFEGSGIGLALVQELAKLHGGTVRAESDYGRGSQFVVSIPLGRAHLPIAQTTDEVKQSSLTMTASVFVDEALRWFPSDEVGDPRPGARDSGDLPANPTTFAGPRPTILFADDNADLRDYVRRLLSDYYTVETVTDGEAALLAASEELPDLLLADVMMPRLDGFGLLKAWRAQTRTRNIPVILLSARAGEESRVEGLTAGADDYLVKPFSARELLARVSARLEITRLHRQALEREQKLRLAAQNAEQALKQARDELEQNVHQRTSQLSVINTELIKEIADRERAEVELTRVKDELAADLKTMIGLHELSTRLLATTQLQPLLEEILDAAIELLDADFGNIQLRDPDSRTLRIVAHRGFNQHFLDHFSKVDDEGASCGRAMLQEKRVIVEDVNTDPGFEPHRHIIALAGFRAVQSTPLFNRDGEPLGMISTHFRLPHRPSDHDLRFLDLYAHLAAEFIERRHASEALSASENRFRRYFELGLIGMAITSPSKGILEVNDELCRILGYERKELLKMTWADMTHPEDLAADVEQFNRVLSSENDGYTLDKRWICKDGRIIHSIMSAKGVRGPDGSVDYLVGLVLDTTERKEADAALRRSEQNLADGQRLSHTGSWRWNVATGECFWSLEHYRIFGLDPETFNPTMENTHRLIHPEDLPYLQEVLDQALREKSDFQVEYRLIRPDGTIRYHRSVGHPEVQESGELEFIGSVMDLTERRLAEDELRKAQAELAHVSRVTTLGELTASIAHEVNQPLGAIVTNGQACLRLLSCARPDLTTARECVDSIITDAVRASEVIKRIRAMLKKSTGGKSSHRINNTIRDVLDFTAAERGKNKISLTTELSKGLPLVIADRVQIQQVVLNLVLNSIEAMSEHEWQPRNLLIKTEQSRVNEVLITISDSGVGIEPQDRERIFEPFFTSKEGGLGLGLSISRTIIAAHGGRLWTAPNKSGPGTTFSFTLPAN
jgi:PAS domain S-box-containing protein